MTRCPHCGHEFHNVTLRKNCPHCAQPLKPERASNEDDSPDIAGFAVGLATGLPLSPAHGISGAALVGAALHSSGDTAKAAETDPAPAPSIRSGGGDYGGGGSSASYDSSSSSSSSSSSDSGNSGGGGGSD